MLKNYTSLCFAILISVPVYGQQEESNLDKMPATPALFARVMLMTDPTEEQFDTIWAVAQNYYKVNADSALILAEHAAKITQKSKDRGLYGKALYLHGKRLLERKNEVNGGMDLVNKAIEVLKSEKQTAFLSNVESSLGHHFVNINQLDKGMEHFLAALDWAKMSKDSAMGLISPMMGVSAIYFKMGSFEKASAMMSEAIKTMEASGFDMNLATAYSNQAKFYRRNGIKYEAMAELPGNEAAVYLDSAKMFFRTGLENASRGLEVAKTKKRLFDIVGLITTIADLKNKLGDYKTALSMATEALPMAEKVGFPLFLANCHYALAQSKRNMGLVSQALQHAEAGYEIVKKNPGSGDLGHYEEELYRVHKAAGNTQKALEMLEIAQKRQKQTLEETAKKAITDAETKYRTLEKERENLQLAAAKTKVERQRNSLLIGGLLIGFLGFLGFRFQKVKKERNDRIEFTKALIFAQEEERKRIGQDLHDGIGQSLLLIKKQLTENTQVSHENQKMIADTLDEVRSISQDLHPFQLEKFGLSATINEMLLKIERSTDLFITKEIDNIDTVLSPKSQIHLYRTIQESLSNIVKHAEATAAKITVKNLLNKIQVNIMDNGKGFDLELAVVTSKSLGIKTMNERIAAIGGQLKIGKGASKGTQIEISLPK